MNDVFTLRDLPDSERPRERLQRLGAESLSAHELLAIILGSGNYQDPVMDISQNLIRNFGSLAGLAAASWEDLCQIRGIGKSKASQLKACLEIGRRCHDEKNSVRSRFSRRKKKITSAKEVYCLVRSRMVDCTKEHLVVLSFDSRSRLIGIDTVSVGTLTTNLVHPREVFDTAIARHAATIIIVHNHPSGDVNPSPEDVQVTKRLVEAGKIMGIEVLDHVIVARGTYFSLKEKEMI